MRLIHLPILLLLSGCGAAAARTPAPAPASEPERVVQAHVEAFNRRDIDAFMATYAPTAIHWAYPADTVWNGAGRIRAYHAELFADPAAQNMHVQVRERIVKDRFVIDHEFYRGLPGEDTHVGVAIYEVVDGLIANIWFIN